VVLLWLGGGYADGWAVLLRKPNTPCAASVA